LHVSGLSGRVEERDLEDAFSKYGRVSAISSNLLGAVLTLLSPQVQKAQVMRDPHTKDPRGFGFVTMETPEEAEAATSALNATELGGKVISIEKARRGRARTRKCTEHDCLAETNSSIRLAATPGMYHGPPKPREDEGRYRSSRYDDRYYDRYRDDRYSSDRYRDDRYRDDDRG